MERYEKYKDSGVQWLGKIPEHWGLCRAKYMFKKNKRSIRPEDEVITCFRDGEVTLRKNRRTTGFTESYTEAGYQGIRKNDLVIHQMDAFAGAIGVADSDGKGTSVYHCCTPLGDYEIWFYAYFIRTMAKSGFIQSLYRGIRERSSDFNFPTFGKQYLVVPPLAEQQAIVSFLDKKTSAIDSMIADKENVIGMLQDAKQTIIAKAVTRGLDSDVELKDSGIDWIGQIPKHWKFAKARAVLKEKKVKNKGNVEDNVLSLSYGNIIRKKIKEGGLCPEDFATYQIVEPGDIILRLTDLQNDHRSLRTGFVNERGIITSAYLCLNTSQDSKYMQLLLHSYDTRKVFYGMGGGLRQSMNYADVSKLYVSIPPLAEQHAIVTYITEKTSAIDSLVNDLQEEIELLKEYKQRLISDAVTGQIKVC